MTQRIFSLDLLVAGSVICCSRDSVALTNPDETLHSPLCTVATPGTVQLSSLTWALSEEGGSRYFTRYLQTLKQQDKCLLNQLSARRHRLFCFSWDFV